MKCSDQSCAIDHSLEHPILQTAITAKCTALCPPVFHGEVFGVDVSWHQLMEYREYLVRFARRKLHDPSLAEDAVHDVFEAVLSGCASFAGRSALRSWLTAILKNKIVDTIRQRARFDSLECGEGDDDNSAEARVEACDSAGPEEIATYRELLAHTLGRIAKLPQGLRDVMQFRVLQDESSVKVCRRLGISEASLFVRLHRARKQLVC